MKNMRGSLLMEVLVGLALLAAASTAIMVQIDHWQSATQRADKVKELINVMVNNATEVNIKSRANLPAGGNCLIRRYDLKGNFKSESTVALVGGACPTVSTDMEIVVTWRIPLYSSLSVVYVPAATLKLPKYTEAIKEVEITGTLFNSEMYPPKKPIAVTVFKR